MEIFEKIGEVATQTYKYTTEKADKFARETKLKMKMNENKVKIEELYSEIGETVYRRHISVKKEDFDAEITSACEEIDRISDEIRQQNKELLSLKDIKQCVNCYEKIDKEAKYCPNCGIEQGKEKVCEDKKEEIKNEEEKEEEAFNDPIEVNATEEEKASNDSNEV